jgi:transcriptional regulator with XRE-family HTH domain
MAKSKAKGKGRGKAKGAAKPGPIASAILATVKARGLTAYRLAQLSKVSVDTIQRFLNGERSISLASAEALVTTLGITVQTPPEPPPSAEG